MTDKPQITGKRRNRLNIAQSQALTAVGAATKLQEETRTESKNDFGFTTMLDLDRIRPDAEQVRKTLKLTPELAKDVREKVLGEGTEDGSTAYFDALRKSEPPCEEGERKEHVWQDLVSLAQSIRSHTLLQPIVVNPRGKEHVIVAGERRFLASILAGNTKIWAVVREARPPELKLRVVQWAENAHRSDLTIIELVDFIRDVARLYREEAGVDVSAEFFMTELNLSRAHAYRYYGIASAPDESFNKVRSLVVSGQITSILDAAAWISSQSEMVNHRRRGSGGDRPLKLGKAEKPEAVRSILLALQSALKDKQMTADQKKAFEKIDNLDLMVARDQRIALDIITSLWNEVD